MCAHEQGDRPLQGHGQAAGEAEKTRSSKETLEAGNDLREFLKVAKPEWSLITRRGKSNINLVMGKLQDIGVTDIYELMRRVMANTINMDLSEAGHTRFSEETIQALRSQQPFLRALKHCKEPHYRQAGIFAPVPLLLAKSYTQGWGGSAGSLSGPPGSAAPSMQPSARPATAGSPARRKYAPGVCPRTGTARPHHLFLHSARPGSAPHRGKGPTGQLNSRSRTSAQLSASGRRATTAVSRSASAPALQLPIGDGQSCRGAEEEEDQALLAERPRLRYTKGSSSLSGSGRGRHRPQSAAIGIGGVARKGCSSSTKWVSFAEGSAAGCCSPSRSASATASCDGGDGSSADAEVAQVQLEADADYPRSQPRIAAWRPAAAVAANSGGGNGGGAGGGDRGFPGLGRAASAVIAEAQALEEKDHLFKQMRREGAHSATRKVIASNIKSRLLDAADRDKQKVADVHQRCTRIRKNLEEMRFARTDLRSLKKSSKQLLSEQDDPLDGLRHRFSFVQG